MNGQLTNQHEKPTSHTGASLTGEVLFLQFKDGNEQAFRIIFRMYYKRVTHYAFKIIGDMQAAEDITTESFCRLHTGRMKFVCLAQVKAFLYMANRNACFSLLKARQRHHAAHLRILASADTYEELPVGDIPLHRQVEMHLSKLPPQCAAVFKLIFYENRKTDEIAAIVGTTPKTVLNQKLKAIKLLKQAIEKTR